MGRAEWYRGRVKRFCLAWSERHLSESDDPLNPDAMTHALAEQFKPSVVTCLDSKRATVHFPDGESVDVQLLYR